MTRITNLDWLPIELAKRDLRPGSLQVVLLYRPAQHPDECYLEYSASNPSFASHQNAIDAGYTEFALLVDD